MKISIAGCGYVGLSLGALLCETHEVTFVDVSDDRIEKLSHYISPIRDEGIEAVLAKRPEYLATTDPKLGYGSAELIFICVPTDYSELEGRFDTSRIEEAMRAIDQVNENAVICVKSTVPIGYSRDLAAHYPNHPILFSPEFLREGHALEDNRNPSRIVVGHAGNDKEANLLANLLKENASTSPVVLVCGYEEAESIKLFSNTYLAMRVAFFNELDTYAKTKGFDATTIVKGVSLDPRIGDYYNRPSFGYGGYCLPKDTKQLLSSYDGVPEDLISATIQSNNTRKHFVAEQALLFSNGGSFGIDCLIMKPDSDNFRQSAALDILDELVRAGRTVYIYEPLLKEEAFRGATVVSDKDEFERLAQVKLRTLENRIDS